MMATNASVPRLLVVAGPSGVGKGTLLNRLRARFPDTFGYSVSYTSRKQRPGEENGNHYIFVDQATFEKGIAEKQFVEYAKTYGNYYGTATSEIQRIQNKGQICLLEVDLEGVAQIQTSVLGPNSYYIFIRPPSLQALESRLRKRSTETDTEITTRVNFARDELTRSEKLQFDCVLVNDDLDVCYCLLEKEVCRMYPFLCPPNLNLAAGATTASVNQVSGSSDNTT